MADTDVLMLDATAQAALVQSKQISSRELVAAAIARIQDLDPRLDAVIHQRFEKALAEAERTLAGPFAGVPCLLKDLDVFLRDEPFHDRTHGGVARGRP